MSLAQIAALLDLVPALRRIPVFIMPIKKEGRQIHKRELNLFRGFYLAAKKGLNDGSHKVAFHINDNFNTDPSPSAMCLCRPIQIAKRRRVLRHFCFVSQWLITSSRLGNNS
jgi:hypothetical protein